MLVEAAANEAGAALVRIRPSSILSKFHGESERSLKKIFDSLTTATVPTVLFFDEFDSLACARGSGDDGQQGRRLLAELLLQMTALKQVRRRGGQMVVVAATNRIEDIDEAAVRRFETRVYVGTPSSVQERVSLVQGFLAPGHVPHALQAADLREIAAWTCGWSGSDIECMCRDASMAPVRRAFPLGAKMTANAASGSWSDQEKYERSAGAGMVKGTECLHGPGLVVTLQDFQAAYLRATAHMALQGDADS